MKYILLIYDNEQNLGKMTQEEVGKMMGEYRAFGESIRQSGNHQLGAQLQPTANATSVQVRNGKRLVTAGPFAETREQLGGFYLVEAKDLDEAIAIAERIPSAKIGTIEVRPMVEMPPA